MLNDEQEKKVNRKARQSLAWFTTVPMVLHFVRFGNSIILARLLSPADFGIVGIATILLYLSNSLTNFGFSKAIIQRKDITQQHYNVYFSINLGLSILFYFCFNFFSEEIAVYFREPQLEPTIDIIALLFLITALLAVPMTVHKRKINFKILAIAEAVKVLVSMAISFTLALNGFGFWSIIYAMIISGFVSMLIVRMSCSIEPRLFFKYQYFKDLIAFGVWDFLWGQSKMLSDNVDKILIGRVLDVTQLGFYEKAQGFAKMPNEQFSRRLGMVSFSTFSRLQNNPVGLKDYFTRMMVVNAFFTVPLYIGLFSVAENFTVVLLGDKWVSMVDPLKILSFSLLVASLTGPMVSMNIAMGHIKQQTLLRIFGLGVLVMLLLWAVDVGIVMVSFVTLGFNFFMFMATFYLLQKHFEITIKDIFWSLSPAIFSSMILFLSVLLATSVLFADNRPMNLIAGIVAGVVSYTLCVLFVPFAQWLSIREKAFNRLFRNKYVSTLKCQYDRFGEMLKRL